MRNRADPPIQTRRSTPFVTSRKFDSLGGKGSLM